MTLPPGPDTLPIVHLVRWLRDPCGLMDECHARFGDAFTLRMPGTRGDVVIVSDPEVVKSVFGLGAGVAAAGEANDFLEPLLGQHSLLVLDGGEHARHRKLMMPAFHGERMHAYGRTMIELTHRSIDAWPVGSPFAVHTPMQAITLGVILRTVFGVEEGPRLTELGDILRRLLDLSSNPLVVLPLAQRDLGPWSLWGRIQRLKAKGKALVTEDIRRGRSEGTAGRHDVLAMMLDARDEHGEPLSEQEVLDELGTLLTAGHETTATALAWALRWLLTDPTLVARLRAEIAEAGGEPARLAKGELLDATVKESLRLQPVVPLVGRVLKEPLTIGRLSLPAGITLAPSIHLVHRRPELYPEPSRFLPDRFLRFKPAAWEWLPFGGGLRRCIGAAFAIYEMKMVLATVLPRVEMRLASAKATVRGTRRSVTLSPAGGLPVVVTALRSRASIAA